MRSLAPSLALLVAALSAAAANPVAGLERPEPDGRNAAALSLLETAKQDLTAGRAAQAAMTIERALRIDPQNPTLWHYLGVARRERGDATQADVMTAKSRALTAQEPPPRTVRDMADQLWSSARSLSQWGDDGPTTRSSFAGQRPADGYLGEDDTAYERSPSRQPRSARAAPRDECRVVAGDRSRLVPCDEVQRYFSSSDDSISRRSSRAAAALERYYRRYGSSRLQQR
jgi:hypothetical protein